MFAKLSWDYEMIGTLRALDGCRPPIEVKLTCTHNNWCCGCVAPLLAQAWEYAKYPVAKNLAMYFRYVRTASGADSRYIGKDEYAHLNRVAMMDRRFAERHYKAVEHLLRAMPKPTHPNYDD